MRSSSDEAKSRKSRRRGSSGDAAHMRCALSPVGYKTQCRLSHRPSRGRSSAGWPPPNRSGPSLATSSTGGPSASEPLTSRSWRASSPPTPCYTPDLAMSFVWPEAETASVSRLTMPLRSRRNSARPRLRTQLVVASSSWTHSPRGGVGRRAAAASPYGWTSVCHLNSADRRGDSLGGVLIGGTPAGAVVLAALAVTVPVLAWRVALTESPHSAALGLSA